MAVTTPLLQPLPPSQKLFLHTNPFATKKIVANLLTSPIMRAQTINPFPLGLGPPLTMSLRRIVNSTASADLHEAFAKEFELCRLKHGEHAVILTEPGSRQDYIGAAFSAAKSLGASVIVATVPGGSPAPVPSTHTGAGPGLQSVLDDTLAQDLLKGADFVVDLTREGFIHAPVQESILGEGTRILFICDAPDVLIRNMPKAEDKARVLAGQRLVTESPTMHVTSAAGTDLRVDLTNVRCDYQVGFTDDPGRWDHWPSTMVLCWPELSDGTIVLAPGDIVLPFKEYVRDAVHLTIESGHIVDVDGGADARFLQRYFEDSDEKWAQALSHMGWGLMHSGDWFAQAMYGKHEVMGMDARAFAGNFLWSTGPHPVLHRESFSHLDVAMRDCTVVVGETTVVDAGSVIELN